MKPSDTTLDEFNALMGCVMVGTNPILPQPSWGQDVAYLAFVIDGLRARAEWRFPPTSRFSNLSADWDNPKRAVSLAAWTDDDLIAELETRRVVRTIGSAEIDDKR